VDRFQSSLIILTFFLSLGLIVTPSSGVIIINKTFTLNSNGTILYVGGSGPWNYTSIQAAINDASPGDTVFVFNDSSPYNENVKVNKMINLIGEDRNTTIIDGVVPLNSVSISCGVDNAVISGFTITGDINGNGIRVCSDNNIIQGNKIVFNDFGIEIGIDANYNIITNNIIVHNSGVGIFDGGRDSGSTITWNIIGGNGKNFPGMGGLYIHHSGGIYHHNDFHINWGDNAFVDGPWGSTWDDGSEGNYWDDWKQNPGYPDEYIIPGSWPEKGIDRFPSSTSYFNYPIVLIDPEYYAGVNQPEEFYPYINVNPSSVSWFWEFGDGTTSNETYPEHAYSEPGIFYINVTVTDSQGISDTDKSIIYVGEPPNTPAITGPLKGKPKEWYEYSIVSTDPDGGNLYYNIYWDDGWEDFIGPYPAGEEVNISHRWMYRDTFTIYVYAVDEAGFESEYGKLNVIIPRNKETSYSSFLQFLERFPLLREVLSRLINL
jgi:hypothetical protein